MKIVNVHNERINCKGRTILIGKFQVMVIGKNEHGYTRPHIYAFSQTVQIRIVS